MPLPFETLISYAIVTVMFGVSGAGVSKLRNMQGDGNRTRRSLDQWDKQSRNRTVAETMMDRDRRLTGLLRGQTDEATAPPGFELNNPWRLEKRFS